jgi:hypothetical protein
VGVNIRVDPPTSWTEVMGTITGCDGTSAPPAGASVFIATGQEILLQVWGPGHERINDGSASPRRAASWNRAPDAPDTC